MNTDSKQEALSEKEITRLGSQIVGDVLAQVGVRGTAEERKGADTIAAAWVSKVVERVTEELYQRSRASSPSPASPVQPQTLPEWTDCQCAFANGTATPLTEFIRNYEPVDSTNPNDTEAQEWRRALAAVLSFAPAPLQPAGEQEIDGTTVYLDPKNTKPQWVECPYCGLGTRAQILRGEGVMTGWGECSHYYAASSDAATKPGLFFATTPPDTPGPLTPEVPDLLWVNPVAGAVANHQAGSAFLPYRRVIDTPVVAREVATKIARRCVRSFDESFSYQAQHSHVMAIIEKHATAIITKHFAATNEVDLINELTTYLDKFTITSDNIGDIRRSCFVPWESRWNGIVRDETAEREQSPSETAVGGEAETEICPVCKNEVPLDSMFSYNNVPNAFCQECVDSGRVGGND